MTTFRLEGFTELQAALDEIATKSTRVVVMRRALAQAARPMLDKAIEYAPVDTVTGGDVHLEDNIKISVRATGEVGKAAYAASMRANAGDKIAALAAMRDARRAFRAANPPAILYMGPTENIWWAHFPEFGTRPHANGGRFAGTSHPGSAPDPYMRPAFDAEAKPTIERLAPLIWSEIDKSAKRAARRAAKKG